MASLDYRPHPFRVVSNGPYNKPNIEGSDFVRAGAAAYTMPLLWFVEQKKEYAEKTIEIFNAWSTTLDSIVNHNRQLKVGTYKQYITWFGKPVSGDTISSKQRGKIFPAWEWAYRHYHG